MGVLGACIKQGSASIKDQSSKIKKRHFLKSGYILTNYYADKFEHVNEKLENVTEAKEADNADENSGNVELSLGSSG